MTLLWILGIIFGWLMIGAIIANIAEKTFMKDLKPLEDHDSGEIIGLYCFWPILILIGFGDYNWGNLLDKPIKMIIKLVNLIAIKLPVLIFKKLIQRNVSK
jgi:hypothetical protein